MHSKEFMLIAHPLEKAVEPPQGFLTPVEGGTRKRLPEGALPPLEGNITIRQPDRLRRALQIDRDILLRLGRPVPLRLALQVLVEWAWIIGAIAIALQVDSAWLSVPVILFIGTRQYALLTLMHEFSHRQFSRTRPALNDTLGDAFTALPFLITLHGFRRNHLQHHRATSTAEDPNWTVSIKLARFQFPCSRPRMVWLLLQHCLGVYAIQDLKGYFIGAKMTVDTPRSTQLRQAIFVLLMIGVASLFQLWAVIGLYWFLPMLTSLMALLYLHDVSEHHAMPGPGLEASRTVLTGTLEGFFLGPNGVGFHTEHHLHPSVPFCRLRELHNLLFPQPGYAAQAVVTRGYLSGLLREAAQLEPASGR